MTFRQWIVREIYYRSPFESRLEHWAHMWMERKVKGAWWK